MHTKTARFKAVLFDLDGTLLDTAPDFTIAANILLAAKMLPLTTEKKIRPSISDGSAGIICNIFMIDHSNPCFEETRQELLAFYSKHLTDKTRPFVGISVLLLELEKYEIPWGIVTNKPEIYTMAILDKLKLNPSPGAIICPDHVQRIKPDPESIFLACSQLGVKAEDVVFIGDHYRDIQAGKNAGASTIAAAYGYIDEQEAVSDWGADHVVEHPEDLLSLIFYS
jgi:N-acetyl-D-muramate 6-phosphate phosphatase|tara:strand:- start:1658 stop:2332 length:675 start_codon:yes stop_codon:yes gene_type:complete